MASSEEDTLNTSVPFARPAGGGGSLSNGASTVYSLNFNSNSENSKGYSSNEYNTNNENNSAAGRNAPVPPENGSRGSPPELVGAPAPAPAPQELVGAPAPAPVPAPAPAPAPSNLLGAPAPAPSNNGSRAAPEIENGGGRGPTNPPLHGIVLNNNNLSKPRGVQLPKRPASLVQQSSAGGRGGLDGTSVRTRGGLGVTPGKPRTPISRRPVPSVARPVPAPEEEPSSETFSDVFSVDRSGNPIELQIKLQSSFVDVRKLALLKLINKFPEEEARLIIAKLIAVSSQTFLAESISYPVYINFVGRSLEKLDKKDKKDFSSPVDYANDFWGEQIAKDGRKAGKVYRMVQSEGIEVILNQVYDMYQDAGVKLFSRNDIKQLGVKKLTDTIISGYHAAGFAGRAKSKTVVIDGYTVSYETYFQSISNALINLAKEIIKLQILLRSVVPQVESGYKRFKRIIVDTGSSQFIGNYIASEIQRIVGKSHPRNQPFHYYLDALLALAEDSNFEFMKGQLGIKLKDYLSTYANSDDSRDKAKYDLGSEYIASNMLGQDLDIMRADRKKTPRQTYQVSVKAGKPSDIWNQRGGSFTKSPSFAESFLTFLSIEIKIRNEDPEKFEEKAENTIKHMGQIPLVKEFIGNLFDHVKFQDPDEYTFALFKGNIGALEEALHANFSESEISVLKELSVPNVFYSTVPEEYESILGQGAYSLSGEPSSASTEEVDLHGVGEDIVVTKEERATLEKGGIPLGALIYLYFVCLKMSNSTP